MEIDRAIDIIDNEDYEIVAGPDDIFWGLDFLRSIDPEIDDGDMNTGHDQLWVGDFIYTTELMTEPQFLELLTRGWFSSEDSWSHFV